MTHITDQPTLDDRDRDIVKARWRKLALRQARNMDRGVPTVGDAVVYPDGGIRWVSYVWDWPEGSDPSVQTSDDGSFYLSEFGVLSFSGSLHPGIPASKFHLPDSYQSKRRRMWIFHHDHHTAHNGVEFWLPTPVWLCDERS